MNWINSSKATVCQNSHNSVLKLVGGAEKRACDLCRQRKEPWWWRAGHGSPSRVRWALGGWKSGEAWSQVGWGGCLCKGGSEGQPYLGMQNPTGGGPTSKWNEESVHRAAVCVAGGWYQPELGEWWRQGRFEWCAVSEWSGRAHLCRKGSNGREELVTYTSKEWLPI